MLMMMMIRMVDEIQNVSRKNLIQFLFIIKTNKQNIYSKQAGIYSNREENKHMNFKFEFFPFGFFLTFFSFSGLLQTDILLLLLLFDSSFVLHSHVVKRERRENPGENCDNQNKTVDKTEDKQITTEFEEKERKKEKNL